jgi:hypothetical protein
MSDSKKLQPLAERDYDAIEAAVMETARGRWFLTEYARRNRHADTEVILGAIKRLAAGLRGEVQASDDFKRLETGLDELIALIATTKREMLPVARSQAGLHPAKSDMIADVAEHATRAIRKAAADLQALAWAMREAKADVASCDRLDELSKEINLACTLQNMGNQRATRIFDLVKAIEMKLAAMTEGLAAMPADETRAGDNTQTSPMPSKAQQTAGTDGTDGGTAELGALDPDDKLALYS